MTYPKNIPSVTRLRELFDYDEQTGVFKRRVTIKGCNAKVGAVCGSNDGKGYLKISIDGRQFFAHRMAWAFVHGVWPDQDIDHKNGIGVDNRIANLRLATASQNGENQRRAHTKNLAGLLGVCSDRRSGKFEARICARGVAHHLGTFETAQAAHRAYVEAKQGLHEYGTLGGAA